MAIFDFFRRRREPTENQSRPRRIKDDGKRLSQVPELREAWVRLETDYLDEAREAAKVHLHSPNRNVATEALKIVALVSFRKRDYLAAMPMFEQIAKATGSAGDLFNVMTCSALQGDVRRAQEAFEQLTVRYDSGDTDGVLSLPFTWYYFGCALRDGGHPRAALPMVQKLRPVYEQMKITDDTFVYIRGVPFLSHTMALAIDVFRSLGNDFDAAAWVRDFSKSLDEEGQTYLTEVLDKLTSQEPGSQG